MRITFQRSVDVLLAIACVTIAGLMIEQRFASPAAAPRPQQSIRAGDKLPALPGVKFDVAQRTLVIVTKSTCPFCEQSTAFWQRLVQESNLRKNIRVLAVSDESAEVTRSYLGRHGVQVDGVVSATLRVPGTPTLILVDGKGNVTHTWVGRPPSEQAELKVIDTLTSPM